MDNKMPSHGIYLQLFSIHGLIRNSEPELGRDADTGGQIKYVLELAKALGQHPHVGQVDLFTRLIKDKTVAEIYSVPVEQISENVRIIRIRCGGQRYMRKELLWPHLEEFIDQTIKFIKKEGRVPDLVHGHYADGGYVGMQLADAFEVPFLFTGHSLGRNKKQRLLGKGMNSAEINKQYRIDHRIKIEEKIICHADLIITSTKQEIEKQYGLYENYKEGKYEIVPPGIDIEIFYPYYDTQLDPNQIDEAVKQVRILLMNELYRFWTDTHKPFILALCRPDQRKNITGLIDAYGKDKDLQAIANMAIFAGIRKDIKEMEDNERNVLTDMLLSMDYYDLYGKLAIPKKHNFATEVPELYRLCADSRGVFVNPALIEPFGITLIEAASCGLPLVATNDGGPVDIINNCQNGTLVDTSDSSIIADAIKDILVSKVKWDQLSSSGINGVRTHYAWEAHCTQTILAVNFLLPVDKRIKVERKQERMIRPKSSFGKRFTLIDRALITDIDNTLIGHKASLSKLLNILKRNEKFFGWGVATGRTLEMTLEALAEYKIPIPDIIITSVGTEIYYGSTLAKDKGWTQYISYRWQPDRIREVLSRFDFIGLQEVDTQRMFKISYYMKDDQELLAKVHKELQQHKLMCQVIFSHGQFLDILPIRASKGKAIKYFSYKWEIAPSNIMVAKTVPVARVVSV